MENVPSYINGDWSDDQVVPDWRLDRRTGNTNLLLLMHNYTFTCTGRITTWYLWWRMNRAIYGCKVDFTIYVLRPSIGSTDCGTKVIGTQVITMNLYTDRTFVSRVPEVFGDVGELYVQKGDFVGVQISIGSTCSESTEVWLRGIDTPNTVSLRRTKEYISQNVGCQTQEFSRLERGVGFISALVGESNYSLHYVRVLI